MRLVIADPSKVLIDQSDVRSVRAESDSGCFGILNGHADFLTTLPPSVVTWEGEDGELRHCAVSRGVLSVAGGRQVRISTREGHVGASLEELEGDILARYRAHAEAERAANSAAAKLRLEASRRIVQALRGASADVEGFSA